MESWQIIRDIVVLLISALLVGLLFQRLKQSAIVGCILAGTLVGRDLLGWVGHGGEEGAEALHQIAELGVAMLLFTIGLEVSWKRFRSFGSIALVGGSLQVILTAALAALGSRLLGMEWPTSLALGAIVSMSSTATVLRALTERQEVESLHGRASLAILIMQDIWVVPLVLMVTFAGGEGGLQAIVSALGTEAGKGAVLVAALMVAGNLFIPRLFRVSALVKDRELPVILAVVTWLAATWAAYSLGLSTALGAFAAGMILAGSPFAAQIRADVAPFRIVFVTLFFASLGLLADLHWMVQPSNLVAVLGLAAGIIIGKALIVWLVLRLVGRPNQAALAAGIALANIGEFSFVFAAISQGNGVINSELFNLVVSTTLCTLLVTPLLVGHADTMSRWVERKMIWLGVWKPGMAAKLAEEEKLLGHVIIVGFGPAGQGVAAALQTAGVESVIIDLNPMLLARAVAEGRRAALADATRRDTLEHLDIESASAVVVTVPDHRAARVVVEQARTLAPKIPIIVRARYHSHVEQLQGAGAMVVVDEEEIVGHLLGAESVMAVRQRQ